jgi:hypothetical protein
VKIDIDALAQEIRRLDGSHALGAGALAEALAPYIGALIGADSERLDYIERTFSGMTNMERYLPVQMIWGAGCNGRTLREACDKYMKRRHLP